jgi:hypothetical protein
MTTRRNFLEELIAAGLLTGAAATAGLSSTDFESLLHSETAGQKPDRSGAQDGKHDAGDFWNNFFEAAGPATRGGPKPKLEDQDRKVQYLHHSTTAGLRYVHEFKPEELLDYDGDVMVNAALGQFRPGVDDHEMLQSVKSSQLRVDFVQTKSFMNILAPMAWAALAVFAHDKPGKIPSLDQMGYKPANVNGIQKVLLPGGTGRFAVNVSTLKPESALHKILKIVVPIAMAAAPVLNLPGLCLPVLKTFTELCLGPDSDRRTTFLLNSLPAQWTATQQARSDPDLEVENLPLVSGNYVMVPQAHAEELGKEISKLQWQSGYLISKDAPSTNVPLSTLAEQVIPGVTYVSMRLSVTPVPIAQQKAASEQGGGGGDSSGGGSKPKPSGSPKAGPSASPSGSPRPHPTQTP